MAFAIKYNVSFKSFDGDNCAIEFLFDPWTGGQTQLVGSANPVKIHYHGADKHQTVVGSTAEIELVYRSEIDDLFVEDDQVVKVIIRKASWTWTGWLLPIQSYRRLGAQPFFTSIVASDQLGALKSQLFRDGSDDPYYGVDDEMTFLSAILQKTGLTQSIYENINIYEDAQNSTTSDSPLTQTYWLPERYWDEVTDESADCYTVLEDAVKKWGARVFQRDDKWYIQRPNAMWSDHTQRVFTYLGVYSSTSTDYFTLNRVTDGGVWLANPEIERANRYGAIRVENSPGERENLIYNGTFEDFTQTGGVLDYWTVVSGTNLTVNDGYINIGAVIHGVNIITVLGQSVDIKKTDGFKLIVEFKPNYTASETTFNMSFLISFISKTGSGVTYTYTPSGWSTSPSVSYGLIDLTSITTGQWNRITIDIPVVETESDYTMYVGLMEPGSNNGNGSIDFRNVRFESSNTKDFNTTYVYRDTNPGLNKNEYRTELVQVDVEDGEPLDAVDSYNQLQLSTGVTTDSWYLVGRSPEGVASVNIQDLYAFQILEGGYYYNDIIRGTLKGSTYDYHYGLVEDWIKDPYGFSKVFIGLDLEFNVAADEWSGTWTEVAPVYDDLELDWDSDTFDMAVITDNEIVVVNSDGDGAGELTQFLAVAGEMFRIVLTLVDDGSSALPEFWIEGSTQTRAWGTNYYEYRMDTASNLNIIIGDQEAGDNLNFTATIKVYALTGL